MAESSKKGRKGQRKGICTHSMAAWDTHPNCPSCQKKLGFECADDNVCQACVNWSETEWTKFYGKDSYAARKARAAERAERMKTPAKTPSKKTTPATKRSVRKSPRGKAAESPKEGTSGLVQRTSEVHDSPKTPARTPENDKPVTPGSIRVGQSDSAHILEEGEIGSPSLATDTATQEGEVTQQLFRTQLAHTQGTSVLEQSQILDVIKQMLEENNERLRREIRQGPMLVPPPPVQREVTPPVSDQSNSPVRPDKRQRDMSVIAHVSPLTNLSPGGRHSISEEPPAKMPKTLDVSKVKSSARMPVTKPVIQAEEIPDSGDEDEIVVDHEGSDEFPEVPETGDESRHIEQPTENRDRSRKSREETRRTDTPNRDREERRRRSRDRDRDRSGDRQDRHSEDRYEPDRRDRWGSRYFRSPSYERYRRPRGRGFRGWGAERYRYYDYSRSRSRESDYRDQDAGYRGPGYRDAYRKPAERTDKDRRSESGDRRHDKGRKPDTGNREPGNRETGSRETGKTRETRQPEPEEEPESDVRKVMLSASNRDPVKPQETGSGTTETQKGTPRRPFLQTDDDREVDKLCAAGPSSSATRDSTPSPTDSWHWKADDSTETSEEATKTRSKKEILQMIADIEELGDHVVFETSRTKGRGTAATALNRRDARPEEIPKSLKVPDCTDYAITLIDEKISGKRDRGRADGPLTKDFLEGPIKTQLWRYGVEGMPPPQQIPKIPQDMLDWIGDLPGKVSVPLKYLDSIDAAARGQVQACIYADQTAAAMMYTGYSIANLLTEYRKDVQKVVEKLPEQYRDLFPKEPETLPTLKELDSITMECSDSIVRAHDLAWYLSTNARLVKRDVAISKLPKNVPNANKIALRTGPIEIKTASGKGLLFDPETIKEAKEAEKKELERSLLTQRSAPQKSNQNQNQNTKKQQDNKGQGGQGNQKKTQGNKKVTGFQNNKNKEPFQKKGGGESGGGGPNKHKGGNNNNRRN